jgi:hypothetical protein
MFSVQISCSSILQPQVFLFLLHFKMVANFTRTLQDYIMDFEMSLYSGVALCNFSTIIFCVEISNKTFHYQILKKKWRNIFLLSHESENYCTLFLLKKH